MGREMVVRHHAEVWGRQRQALGMKRLLGAPRRLVSGLENRPGRKAEENEPRLRGAAEAVRDAPRPVPEQRAERIVVSKW